MTELLAHPWFKYVLLAIFGGAFVYRYFKKGMDEATNEKAKYNYATSTSLSTQQEFSLALDAIISTFWQVDQNTLSFTKNGKKPSWFKDYMEGWYIDTREGYIDLTEYFLHDGRRGYFSFLYPLFKNEDRENWESKMEEEYGDNKRARQMLERLDKYNLTDHLKSEGIIEFDSDMEIGPLGWDISTLIGQARRAYTVNLISEEEALEVIEKATRMAKENFNSWQQFGRSQMIGFAMDFYKNPKDKSYYNDYMRIYHSLQSDPNSPWNTITWQN